MGNSAHFFGVYFASGMLSKSESRLYKVAPYARGRQHDIVRHGVFAVETNASRAQSQRRA